MIVLRCAGGPGILPAPAPVGQFLKSYDPEAHDGMGDAEFTADLDEAMEFDSIAEAVRLWHQVPESRPWRVDGQPNRPLTAFSMEFVLKGEL